jgi:hypothetical protein
MATRSMGAWRWMIQAVTQAQRPVFVLRQLPGQETLRLIAKFRDALADEGVVEVVRSDTCSRIYGAGAKALKYPLVWWPRPAVMSSTSPGCAPLCKTRPRGAA